MTAARPDSHLAMPLTGAPAPLIHTGKELTPVSTTSFIARMHSAWEALAHPAATSVEHALIRDRAQRDPEERDPTKLEYGNGERAVAGLSVRVRRSRPTLDRLQGRLLAAKADVDTAVKHIQDYAGSPRVAETLARAERLRREHPLHEERRLYRSVHMSPLLRIVIETVILIADFGIWFGFLVLSQGLSFTRMASANDPTRVFNPGFFLAHPFEWLVAFAVPLAPAITVLAVAKVAGRYWARAAAVADDPERVGDLEARKPERSTWMLTGMFALLGLASAGYYILASTYFRQFSDDLGWYCAVPWAIFPFVAALVERYKHDPIGQIDASILQQAADVQARKELLSDELLAKENAWLLAWKALDREIRRILDGAADDLALYEQILMRAHSAAGHGGPLAPISELAGGPYREVAPQPVVTAEGVQRTVSVQIEEQRGLVTKLGPWRVKQLEGYLTTLVENRALLDEGVERAQRVIGLFEDAHAEALLKREEAAPAAASAPESSSVELPVADAVTGADATPEPTAPVSTGSGAIVLGAAEQEAFEQLRADAEADKEAEGESLP